MLFEKKIEKDRPVWTMELVKNFCEDQKYDVVSYEDSTFFVVVKLTDSTDKKTYRLVEITPTLTFLIEDEPSLDEFLEKEPQEVKEDLPDLRSLIIEEEKEG